MNKVYLFVLAIATSATVVFFQNCSRAQFKANSQTEANSNVLAANDVTIVTNFDETTPFKSINATSSEDNSAAIYEFRISGGMRPFCNSEEEFSDGFEARCSTTSGFRLLSNGSIQRFFQFLNNKEIKYNIGYYDQEHLANFVNRSNKVQVKNANLVDQNEGVPMCADAPSVQQFLYSEIGKEYILAQNLNCHVYLRSGDKNAVVLSNEMERLARKVSEHSLPKSRILIEKNMGVFGMAPVDYPRQAIVRVYFDGRVVKFEKYLDESKNNVVLVQILSRQQINQIIQDSSDFSLNDLKIVDIDKSNPLCQDAPSVEYFVHKIIPSQCSSPMQGSENYSCREESVKIEIAKSASCHNFLDAKFQKQTENMIKFLNQF